jgi:hypothetical protein
MPTGVILMQPDKFKYSRSHLYFAAMQLSKQQKNYFLKKISKKNDLP